MDPVAGTSGTLLQESLNTIPGAQSQTVHQILAYLANGSPCEEENACVSVSVKHPGVNTSKIQETGNHNDEANLTAEELFRLIMNDHHYLKMDVGSGLGCDTVPNAADIQKFFLETINLIAFKPIKDSESGSAGQPVQADDIQQCDIDRFDAEMSMETEDMESVSDTEQYKAREQMGENESRTPNVLLKEEREKRKKERQIWATECRTVLGKVQHNSFINHALNLLEKYWKQYLATPLAEINQQVVESAQELNLTEEVVEMLEDKSRYIWQIIEEMPPRDLQLPF